MIIRAVIDNIDFLVSSDFIYKIIDKNLVVNKDGYIMSDNLVIPVVNNKECFGISDNKKKIYLILNYSNKYLAINIDSIETISENILRFDRLNISKYNLFKNIAVTKHNFYYYFEPLDFDGLL